MSLISLPGNSNIKVPGFKSDPNPHITLVYLGEDLDALDLLKVIKIVTDVCSNTLPFLVKANYTSLFSKGDKGYPIICPIESSDIYVLRDKIVFGLINNRISFPNTYMSYRPHQTVFFNDKVIPSVPINISWVIDRVNIWPANKGTRGEIPVPMSMKIAV